MTMVAPKVMEKCVGRSLPIPPGILTSQTDTAGGLNVGEPGAAGSAASGRHVIIGCHEPPANRVTRRRLEAIISSLIDILDAMDGDTEAEEDIREDDAGDACEVDEDREPALGWTEGERQTFGVARFGDVSVYDEDEEFSFGEGNH